MLTDFLFYKKHFVLPKAGMASEIIHNDYDILNKYLIEKYNVEICDNIKDKVFFQEGETKIINREIAERTIYEASKIELDNIKTEILSNEYIEKWDKIRTLKILD